MIKFAKPILSKKAEENISEVLSSGVFVHGKKTALFEELFKTYFRVPYCSSMANCTVALFAGHYLLSKRHKVDRRRNEVICTSLSHVATVHSLEMAGLRPVFVDVDGHSGNIDINKIREVVNERTIGIALVHFNGMPCDIGPIVQLANANDIYIIEDCAISLGAKYEGKAIGSFGDCGTHSFHPVKQLTTGEGGMFVTKDEELLSQVSLLKAFGVTKQFNDREIGGLYDVISIGNNFRLSEMPAALGCAQIELFEKQEKIRKSNYNYLAEYFHDDDRVSLKGSDNSSSQRAYYTFILEIKGFTASKRNELSMNLKKSGLETSIYYPHPLPRLNYYQAKYGYDRNSFPNAESFSDSCLSIPIGPHLSQDDIAEVCKILEQNL